MGSYTRERLQRVAGILAGVIASPDIPELLTDVLVDALKMIDELLDNEMKSNIVKSDSKNKPF